MRTGIQKGQTFPYHHFCLKCCFRDYYRLFSSDKAKQQSSGSGVAPGDATPAFCPCVFVYFTTSYNLQTFHSFFSHILWNEIKATNVDVQSFVVDLTNLPPLKHNLIENTWKWRGYNSPVGVKTWETAHLSSWSNLFISTSLCQPLPLPLPHTLSFLPTRRCFRQEKNWWHLLLQSLLH